VKKQIKVMYCLFVFILILIGGVNTQNHKTLAKDIVKFNFGQGDISPDGKSVVFSYASLPKRGIAVIGVDGKGFAKLSADYENGVHPKWSPDGKSIVYSGQESLNSPSSVIYLINPDGSGHTALTSNKDGTRGSDTNPTWITNKDIIFMGKGVQTYHLDITTGELTQVQVGDSNINSIVYSSEKNKQLTFSCLGANGQAYCISDATGLNLQMFEVADGSNFNVIGWSSDSTSIMYLMDNKAYKVKPGKKAELIYQPAKGRYITSVVEFTTDSNLTSSSILLGLAGFPGKDDENLVIVKEGSKTTLSIKDCITCNLLPSLFSNP